MQLIAKHDNQMRISGIKATHIDFGFSIARESLRAVDVFLHPASHAEQMPWVRSARRRVRPELREQLQHYRFFFEEQPEIFPRVWSSRGAGRFEQDLARLARSGTDYRDAVVRRLRGAAFLDLAELRRLRRPSWYKDAAATYMRTHPASRALLTAFTKSPSGTLRGFCEMLRLFYAAAIEAEWGDVATHLQSDIDARRRVLRKYGVVALLRTLDEHMTAHRTLHGASIEVGGPGGKEVILGPNDALTLTPSFFVWQHRQVHVLREVHGLDCTIAYALPPLTHRRPPLRGARIAVRRFAAVGHPKRWRILELLAARELSTRELAGYLHLAEPLVSRHLQQLLAAELVTRRRAGYFVLYGLDREAFKEVAALAAQFAQAVRSGLP
ncbi:MAG TPA: metalloregulator ArsR/SmtB family transcription factor [Candidatus Baltobacteraceae bacterium]|jgi:DNA-binding transcriptional ArsR family regulator|nr:metalloregulator ArsR/SmtB family transcription factor [Candidatus Baltobacteraceae bacterium]